MKEYYVKQNLAVEKRWVVMEHQKDKLNDMIIAWCGFLEHAQLICDALNARESLARALGVKLDG